MIYKITDILRDMKIALNLGQVPCADGFPPPFPDTDAILRSLIETAAAQAITEAPLRLLDGGRSFENPDVFLTGDGRGWIPLPDDFLRLIRFRMSDWKRPVCELADAGSLLYARQWSPWPGIRGNPERPVAAIAARPEGMALEFFTCRDRNPTVAEALYIPRPDAGCDGTIEIPAGCYSRTIGHGTRLYTEIISRDSSQPETYVTLR